MDKFTPLDFPNLPQTCGSIIATGKATLAELQTTYSLEDLYDLMEVCAVSAENERRAMDASSSGTGS